MQLDIMIVTVSKIQISRYCQYKSIIAIVGKKIAVNDSFVATGKFDFCGKSIMIAIGNKISGKSFITATDKINLMVD